MCANFHKNWTKTVGGVAISKKFDDRQTDNHPDISHRYYKLHWLQASHGANNI